MKPSHQEHQTLYRLKDEFDQIESSSLVQPVCPAGSYLCVRLDGVKVSGRYLKDQLVNEQFRKALSKAISTTYYLLRWQSAKENKNFFLCVISLSDEVSLVVNNKNNYYENRSFKIGTMTAGMLSAAMTLNYQPSVKHGGAGKSEQHQQLVTFDARPLFLGSYEAVEKYIQYRWLLGRRNAMCKVLRLEGSIPSHELYETDLKDDVVRLTQEIASRQLTHKVEQALSDFRVFIPDEASKLNEYDMKADLGRLEPLLSRVRNFHQWLNE